jgi:hypothetical protein
MIKLLNLLVETTPGLNYHLKHKLPLSENIYRYSSNAFLQLFTEARTLHRDGYLDLCQEDRILLEETNIGEYGIFEGQQVPLDLPMVYEEVDTDLPRAGEQGGNIRRNMIVTDKQNRQLRIVDITDNKIILKPSSVSGDTIIFPNDYDQFAKIFQFWDYFNLDKINEAKYQGDYDSLQDEIANKEFGMDYNQLGPNEKEWVRDEIDNLNEAKHKGQDVQLNKPKRGGPKKFYVYVKDPKTKNIKKVNFGDSGNLTVKLNEPGARAAFAARHKCAMKKDRTSPGYWSCNIGRYWKSLGGAKNFSGYW